MVRHRFIPAGAGNTARGGGDTRAHPVHPRWRGEHSLRMQSWHPWRGSSPLARGTRSCGGRSWVFPRFIPAGAGNTAPPRRPGHRTPVHPRWRGEHRSSRCGSVAGTGSSPLARGTRRPRFSRRGCSRFIPAGAGNTAAEQPSAVHEAVHPRWRGEHPRFSGRRGGGVGSSPLARGTLGRHYRTQCFPRFIPAGAGNTRQFKLDRNPIRVHPRWRGEHERPARMTRISHGSSPLARGTLLAVDAKLAHLRFIPAGAGNTTRGARAGGHAAVHPRWRGEHITSMQVNQGKYGSSPLARGTLAADVLDGQVRRFIPAGAGNTCHPRWSPGRKTVHPRWRGEHHSTDGSARSWHGSSPLARGTPGDAAVAVAALRFIPAGAGNTPPPW